MTELLMEAATARARFWADSADLGRLFGAQRVCFLIGSYTGIRSYGAALQFGGALNYLRWLSPTVLPVVLLDASHARDHLDLLDRRLLPHGRAAFLLAASPPDSEDSPFADRLTEVVEPPSASAQILVYGGSYLLPGHPDIEESSARVRLLSEWLSRSHGEQEADATSLAVVGVRSMPSGLPGGGSPIVGELLDRSRVIGVADASEAEGRRNGQSDRRVGRVFVSGEEGENFLLGMLPDAVCAQPASDARREGLIVNLEPHPPEEGAGSAREYVETLLEQRLARGDRRLVVNLLDGESGDGNGCSEDWRRVVDEVAGAHSELDVEVVECLAEIRAGFPQLGGADITLASSHHVALTSVALEVPVLPLTERATMPSLGSGGLDVLRNLDAELGERFRHLLSEEGRQRFREFADRSRARVAARATTATLMASNSLAAGYLRAMESEYAEVIDGLRESMAELSDLRFEYERLLNAFSRAQRESSPAARAMAPARKVGASEAAGSEVRKEVEVGAGEGRAVLPARGRPVRAVSQLASWFWPPSRQSLRLIRTYLALRGSGHFDTIFYLTSYRDVARAGLDPLMHYVEHGWHSGRNPNPNFSSAAYLEERPDVARSGVNPLLHYVRYGRHGG